MVLANHTLNRRRLLIGLGAAAAFGAAGAGLTAYNKRQLELSEASAAAAAKESGEHLLAGRFHAAVESAARALSLAPTSKDALSAWVRAEGLFLMEVTPDANRATAFIYKTWKLGARGPLLAFATLSHAVAVGNDRYAGNLLDQHRKLDVAEDPLHDYAAGAALDLLCSAEAEARFLRCSKAWPGSPLPTLRRARSLLFHGRLEECAEELAKMSGPSAGVLESARKRLASRSIEPLQLSADTISDLPRALRAIAYTLSISEQTQIPVDVMLGDVDCAIAAAFCGELAAAAQDLSTAQIALEKACSLRSELASAHTQLIRVRLLRGDLEGARVAANQIQDREEQQRVEAISAYESADLAALKKLQQEHESSADSAPFIWPLLNTAIALLERAKPVQLAELEQAVKAGVSWADMLLFDAALAVRDLDHLDRVVRNWTEMSPARAKRQALRKTLRHDKSP
jgi:hypothetical protein